MPTLHMHVAELTAGETYALPVEQKKLLVEAEIDRFDEEMRKLGNSPLASSERALIRTYLILKMTDRL